MAQDMGEVWVYAEQEEGKLSEVPFELLGRARELAGELGVKVGAVLLGEAVAPLAERLFAAGADRVHLVEDPALRRYRGEAYREAMLVAIRAAKPQIVLFGATHQGRDLAPAVASTLRTGLTADCTYLQIGEFTDKKTGETFANVLEQIRPAFGGNIIATIVNARARPQMATVREGVMRPLAVPYAGPAELVRHDAALAGRDFAVEVVEVLRREAKVNLKGSRIIVAGGAGMGSKAGFDRLHELAALLGASVGASRAAVDLGYCESERQIGQTGVTVRPALFVSCGISGAVQHLAGMYEAAKIIAINSDPAAPIFKVAHYGIVGDVNDVLPKLMNALKAKGK